MTKEEAYKILKNIEVLVFRDPTRQWFFIDVREALDVAIETLKEEINKEV